MIKKEILYMKVNGKIHYEGYFMNNIYGGKGKLYDNGNIKYEDDFKNGKYEGKGKNIGLMESSIMRMEILHMKVIGKMVNMKEKENYMIIMEISNTPENLKKETQINASYLKNSQNIKIK